MPIENKPKDAKGALAKSSQRSRVVPLSDRVIDDIAPASLPGINHLAKLAHELKTPLAAILAAAQVMRDERFGPLGDERYQSYASGICECSLHAIGVVDALLGDAASEPEQASLPPLVELDLAGLVRTIAISLTALIEAAGLTLELDLLRGLPAIRAEPLSVRQMLLNLVTNAMRASSPGGRIVIATSLESVGGVVLSVVDTGRGMSASAIERALAEPPAAGPRSNSSSRMRLGFPLLRGWADFNNATLSIESRPGVGTRVTITFPQA